MNPASLDVTPAATAEEVAAIAAALARLAQDSAVPADTAPPAQTPWQRAALLDGVARASDWG